MKKGIKEELIGLGISLSAGVILTAIAVNVMMKARGSFEFGGELLIIPGILLLEYFIRDVIAGMVSMWDEPDWLEDEEE